MRDERLCPQHLPDIYYAKYLECICDSWRATANESASEGTKKSNSLAVICSSSLNPDRSCIYLYGRVSPTFGVLVGVPLKSVPRTIKRLRITILLLHESYSAHNVLIICPRLCPLQRIALFTSTVQQPLIDFSGLVTKLHSIIWVVSSQV